MTAPQLALSRDQRAPCPRTRSRREILGMLSAAGMGALLPTASVLCSSTGTNPRIIDTHHHIYPPRYVTENAAQLLKEVPGVPLSFYQNWTPQWSLEQMDRAAVASAITSITAPGVWYDDGTKGRARARECNTFGAQLTRDFPGRFGMFATIPLPDVDGSLVEVAYAFDVLKLDGIGLLTSYGDKMLGDAAFKPVFEELNRRKAIVFVHPRMPCCGTDSRGLLPWTVSAIEYPAETARTILSLLMSGNFAAMPEIKFIFSHGGGELLSMYERVAEAASELSPAEKAVRLPRGIDYELRRQHYDLASIARNPGAMAAALKLFPTSQLIYGSDSPFRLPSELASALTQYGLSANDLRAVQHENALNLFPRFRQ